MKSLDLFRYFLLLLLSVMISGCGTTPFSSGPIDAGSTQEAYGESDPEPERLPARDPYKDYSYLQLRQMEEYKAQMERQAAAGDEEAQRWLNQNSFTVQMMRQIFDARVRAESRH